MLYIESLQAIQNVINVCDNTLLMLCTKRSSKGWKILFKLLLLLYTMILDIH